MLSLPRHQRLKYQLQAYNFADLYNLNNEIFEPLMNFLFENKHYYQVVICLLSVCKDLNFKIRELRRSFCETVFCHPSLYTFEINCRFEHDDLPLLPERGELSVTFGLCACCGSPILDGPANKCQCALKKSLSLFFDLETEESYTAPLCLQCRWKEWILAPQTPKKSIVVVPRSCICVFFNIMKALKEFSYKIKFVARQVFANSKTKTVRVFTQFTLFRSNGRKMAVALEDYIFADCVETKKDRYGFQKVLNIQDILVFGINLSFPRLSMRVPGSVFYSHAEFANHGFQKRLMRGCRHRYKISDGKRRASSEGVWEMVDCLPCWQRHVTGVDCTW